MRTFFFIIFTFYNFSTFSRNISYTFNEQCKKSTEIFTGRVIQVIFEKESKNELGKFKTYKIVFISDKLWKGLVFDTMICFASEGICGPNIFELEKKYLVYSENGEISLGSGRSRNIKYSNSDIRKLNIKYLFRNPQKVVHTINKHTKTDSYFGYNTLEFGNILPYPWNEIQGILSINLTQRKIRRESITITKATKNWQFSAPQTHFWLMKHWFFATPFVVKIATFAKPENVICHFRNTST